MPVLVTDPVAARADISVVVVADGTEPGLPDAVRSVLAALDRAARGTSTPGTRLRGERLGGEVVLVVHDVAALPRAARADRRVRVVAAPGVGDGRARNVGVAAARGRYVLLTEPDARVPRDWAVALTAPLRAGRADLVAGAVLLAPALRPARLGAVAAAVLDDLLGLVPDPPPAGAAPGASTGVTRAVLEAVGFDEALGTARYPAAGAAAFRRDVVGAGFREQAVAGVPVERHPDPRDLGRRALAARARAHGRGTAYLERHLRDARPGVARTLLALAGHRVALAGLLLRGAPPARVLPVLAAAAHDRELLRLRHAPYRQRPQSAAGDVPGGAGAPRAAVPVALVGRDTVPRTALPAVDADPAPVAAPAGRARGSVHQFWSPGRSRGADARSGTPVATRVHGTTAS